MLLRILTAVFVIALAPVTASAQRVTKVPDGDTVVVDGIGTIHLLGIKSADEPLVQLGGAGEAPPPRQDVPGSPVAGGRISLSRDRPSRDFLRELALGKTVRIEYDSGDESGQDGRAYVFLENGTLLNAEMLKAGRATVDQTRPFRREEEFKRLEAEARSNAVGIWIR